MTEFYNPYQFIPVDTSKTKKLVNYQNADALNDATKNEFVRHDYWHKKGFSGRIICTLTTLSPLVVGAEQIQDVNKKNASIVNRYIDRNGNPAIPANSLRGMIGNIVETISQSSLRVLVQAEKGAYSVRKPAQAESLGESFAALKRIGILCKTDTGYEIYPLPMANNNDQGISVGDYLDDKKYMDCCEKKKKYNPDINCPSNNRARRKNELSLIRDRKCYQYKYHQGKLDAYECKALSKKYDSGVYFIRGRNDALCKRGETYIPWDGDINPADCFPVDISVINVMENIMRSMVANEKDAGRREKRKHEMLPVGYAEHSERVWELDPRKKERQPLVLEGDLLYFREKDGKVVELSYSAIWRKAVDGSLHGAFHRTAGENSLPWNADRDALTPAEALLGIVEDEPDEKQRGGARNLTSRVRFTDAVSIQPITLQEEVTLKILNSPKPPSPAMYFSAKSSYVAKTALDLNKHAPNGRKQYLPHPHSINNELEDWRAENASDRPHMRLKCNPIPQKAVFQFEVYFENLSDGELGLLLTAIQPAKQGKQFVHRLGLGKPIGLGHVQLSYQVETINRQRNRYSVQGLKSSVRYQPWQQQPNLELVVSDVLGQLRELADPQSLVDSKVCYPFATNKGQSAYHEGEGFKWFGNNDSSNQNIQGQALRKIIAGKPLPTLKSQPCKPT